MDTYKINEIFMSIQGEGPSVGQPAIFIRFAGCNENCEFCDTKFSQYTETDLPGIIRKIEEILSEKKWPINGPLLKKIRCIFTGGEPFLQLDFKLIDAMMTKGFIIGVETNGIKPVHLSDGGLSWIDELTVSPKNIDGADAQVLKRATCLKLIVPTIQRGSLIRDMVSLLGKNHSYEKHLILQPITPTEGIDHWKFKNNCLEAFELAFNWRRDYEEEWKVIPQTHVLMRYK